MLMCTLFFLQEGKTALHHALVHGVVENDMEIAQHLIDYGADVNIKDEVSEPSLAAPRAN
jgi:ankyrin repeat protein